MNEQSQIASINRKTYANAKVLDYYDGLTELFPAEKVLFEHLCSKIENARILDIGIGGGRTTHYLLPRAADYTGLDYVPEFIERVKKKFQTGNFIIGDARDLGEFKDETFDFVLFSYNGIDAVLHEDRIKILNEMNRVLKKNGVIMFSSHNRDYRRFGKPYWLTESKFSLSFAKNLLSYVFFLPRHLQMRRREVSNEEYAIVNDHDHRFSLLVYYISVGQQIKQLEDIGMSDIKAYDMTGEQVNADTDSFWIYYLATKVI
ncbi:MAG: class I SAM-dependent methyltransferase [Acidobacteriota bacterium]|nr:MAG: class I SAM-dependent methyltransferase [Acidobacteriota bacterium]